MYKRLMELRLAHSFSQDYISDILHISLQLYIQYETGAKNIPIKHLSNLAKLYNTSIDYIVEDTDIIKPFIKIP